MAALFLFGQQLLEPERPILYSVIPLGGKSCCISYL